ncbi:MAG: EAL domain-containing protein, partial [Woeseia sp.]
LMRLFPVDICAVCLADIENSTNANMLVRRAAAFDGRRISMTRPFEYRQTRDLTTSAPYWTTAGEVEQVHGIPLDPEEWREVLAIPMTYGGAQRGLLFISTSDKVNFNEEKADLCAKLASRLAIGVASVEREEHLYQKAHYDDLTGLPNRQLLKERLTQCLARTRKQPASGAIIFIDLDRFKEVNDVFGHSVGDVLLRDAASRISAECPEFCTLARLGGDEFVVLMPSYSELAEVRNLAGALIERLSLPFFLNGNDHILGASAGIALFPDDADTVELILRNADSAMYRAKAAGRGRFEFFSEDLSAANQRRVMLERDLRHALRKDELQLFVQPQVAIQTGELRGAECLLRWQHPTLGHISPSEFIPIAEQSGLIVEIGKWLITKACNEWRGLLDDGLSPGKLSINVSRRELEEAAFAEQVFKALRSASLAADSLELEVTESVVARDKVVSLRTLRELNKAGISIAIDDFGTGYSSLSFLRELPLNCIKIDQSFIADLGTDADADAEKLCRTIIRMAHEMGKTVVAEGVEKQGHLDFLELHGCDVAQGFLYARPMPVSEFADFVRAHGVQQQTARELRAV